MTTSAEVLAYEVCEQAIEEEDVAWLPNPYQEQADAQVAAGAWPGMPVLFSAMSVVATPGSSPWGAQDQCFMVVPMEEQQDCSGWSIDPSVALGVTDCWDPDQSWGYYFPVAEEECKALAGGSADSTDEGEAASDSQEESDKSAAEEALENYKECEDGESGKYIRKLSHANVPKNTDMTRFADKVEKDQVTTLMVRNIPNMYTRSMLVEELDSLGFEGDYDFIYLPIDKSTQWNVGYAFVNFKTSEAAKRCVTDVTDYTFNRFEHGSRKVAQISVAHIQGLERNLEYYSKTAVQCARVNAHRPHFVSDRRQEAPEANGRSQRKQRRHGLNSSRHRNSSTGYPPCSADVYLQDSGSWNRGKWH
jgi:hypothetical protein